MNPYGRRVLGFVVPFCLLVASCGSRVVEPRAQSPAELGASPSTTAGSRTPGAGSSTTVPDAAVQPAGAQDQTRGVDLEGWLTPGRYVYDVVWTFEQEGREPRDKGRGQTIFLVEPPRQSPDGLRQDLLHKGHPYVNSNEVILHFVKTGSGLLLWGKTLRSRSLEGEWGETPAPATEPFPYFVDRPDAPDRWRGQIRPEGGVTRYLSGRNDGRATLDVDGTPVTTIRSTIGAGEVPGLAPDDPSNVEVSTYWVDPDAGLVPVAFQIRQQNSFQGILVANVWDGRLVSSP